LRVAKERFDPGQERPPVTSCGRCLLHLGEDGLAVERSAEESVEVFERVEPAVGTQGVLPLLEAERLGVATVGREPRLEDRRLGVDDEPVEVEDDGGDVQDACPQPRAA
jgi:hypothetical protein